MSDAHPILLATDSKELTAVASFPNELNNIVVSSAAIRILPAGERTRIATNASRAPKRSWLPGWIDPEEVKPQTPRADEVIGTNDD